MRIPVRDGIRHIHMKFACFTSDEKAEKEALGVKGHQEPNYVSLAKTVSMLLKRICQRTAPGCTTPAQTFRSLYHTHRNHSRNFCMAL